LGCARCERSAVGGKAFFFWWASMQSQMLFARLPMLEEVLRLIPGLYSFWLRLWGSQIGRLTFWSPGTVILDRGFLSIGDDVVLGAGVRFNPHVIRKNDHGELELQLSPVQLGDRVSIGGYSLLTAGTVIPDDETTRAYLLSPPFSEWKEGRRIKRSD
ncbi:MAG: acyltransferase, partial [Akkermansiaceae bacterium]